MENIKEKKLLQKIAEGVNGKTIWTKPVLLLAKDGDSYNACNDSIKGKFKCRNFTTVDATYINFVRINNKLEMEIAGVVCDGHKPEVDVYVQLGTQYFESVLHYCVNLLEYENKPVLFIICEADMNAGEEYIPAWVHSEFEIMRLE